MKVRKAIKRIVALGIGASMVGATLFGAAATDLSNYPDMFFDDCNFNGLIVVGKNAKSSDTLGGVNIALGLQAEAVKTVSTTGTGGGVITSPDDGVEVGDNNLFYEIDIADVETGVDKNDLTVLLAEGNFDDNEGENDNDQDYEQEILFDQSTGTLLFVQDQEEAFDADSYLYFSKSSGDYAYNYTLDFDTAIDIENTSQTTVKADLKSTVLKIQGKDYTITDVKYSGGQITEIKMLSGQASRWVQEGTVLTENIGGVTYEIKMIDVTDVETESDRACGLEVDGTRIWIDVDDTKTVGGLEIGVLEANPVYAQDKSEDMCKITIGATEIQLRDGTEIKINDEEVDGSNSEIIMEGANKWDGLQIQMTPDDKVYLKAGESWVDPIFGNFQILFGGLEIGNTEELEAESSGKSGSFTFTNKDGELVELDLASDDGATTVYLGSDIPSDDVGDLIYLEGESCNGTSSSIDACEGARFLAINSKKAHIVELDKIDTNNNKIDFKDLTYGTEYKEETYTNEDGSNAFSLGSKIGTVTLFISETGVCSRREADAWIEADR